LVLSKYLNDGKVLLLLLSVGAGSSWEARWTRSDLVGLFRATNAQDFTTNLVFRFLLFSQAEVEGSQNGALNVDGPRWIVLDGFKVVNLRGKEVNNGRGAKIEAKALIKIADLKYSC
jgi:hypothetical protein